MLNLKTGSINGKPILREMTPDEKQGLLNLLTHQKSRLRWIAANEIGKYKIIEGVDPLIISLQDRHWLVRLHAAKALGKIGDKKAVEPLKECIKDACPYVQRRVMVALGELGDESAIPLLLEAIQTDEKMWFYAFKALHHFMGNYAASALINAARENGRNWKSNSRLNKVFWITPILLSLLKVSNGYFRKNILQALGDYGDEGALKDLESLAVYSQNGFIRQSAYQAFGKIQCRKFEKYLPGQTAG